MGSLKPWSIFWQEVQLIYAPARRARSACVSIINSAYYYITSHRPMWFKVLTIEVLIIEWVPYHAVSWFQPPPFKRGPDIFGACTRQTGVWTRIKLINLAGHASMNSWHISEILLLPQHFKLCTCCELVFLIFARWSLERPRAILTKSIYLLVPIYRRRYLSVRNPQVTTRPKKLKNWLNNSNGRP